MSLPVAIGSKNERPDGKYSILRFHISEYYSEREIESLFEEMEGRGAHCKMVSQRPNPGWFELAVPRGIEWEPYRRTLEACESIDEVEKLVVISCQIPIHAED